MEAGALSGMELTLVPPWMVPMLRVVRGSSGKRGLGEGGQRRGQGGDGVGGARVGKAVAAGAGDGDLEAAAAEGLGDGRVRARAVEDDVGGDAAGERALVVEVAHAAQIAFAFFAHVAQEDKRRRAACTLAWMSACAMASMPATPARIVAGSGSFQALSPFADQTGFSGVPSGKNSIEMRGEDDHGAGALGRQVGGGQEAEHVADGVGLDIGQGQPRRSGRRATPTAPVRQTAARGWRPAPPASP